MFFTNKQKSLAFNLKKGELKKRYKKSERDLKITAKSGNEEELAKVMKRHGNYEYAMLFQNTPEFKKRRKLR